MTLVDRLEVRAGHAASTVADALRTVVARHEPLRTGFELVGSYLLQLIPPMEAGGALVSVEAGTEADVLNAARCLTSGNSFDLGTGAVFRAIVFDRTDATNVTVLLAWHHICTDARSFRVLCGELEVLLTRGTCGSRKLLPELSPTFADYAVWLQQPAQAHEVIDHNAGALSRLTFPVADPRAQRTVPAITSIRRHSWTLSPSTTSSLAMASRRTGFTAPAILCTALDLYQYEVTRERLPIGLAFDGRTISSVNELVGFFVNFLPVWVPDEHVASAAGHVSAFQQGISYWLGRQQRPFDALVPLLRAAHASESYLAPKLTFSYEDCTGFGSIAEGVVVSSDAISSEKSAYTRSLQVTAYRDRNEVALLTQPEERDPHVRLERALSDVLHSLLDGPNRTPRHGAEAE